jgi:hypothetical protein
MPQIGQCTTSYGQEVGVPRTPRAVVRDRGEPKNMLNDIQGAVGELIGFELLHRNNSGAARRGSARP